MTTIIANIPSRKIGKNVYASRTETFRQEDDGQWFIDVGGALEKVLQEEVIDVCRKATNWPQIKSAHFPMYGFHN